MMKPGEPPIKWKATESSTIPRWSLDRGEGKGDDTWRRHIDIDGDARL